MATSSATARGEVEISSQVPLDCWPGRNLRITWPGAGLSAADFRITSCSIVFPGGASNREYTIGFGGNVPGLSAMRHLRRKQGPRSRFT